MNEDELASFLIDLGVLQRGIERDLWDLPYSVIRVPGEQLHIRRIQRSTTSLIPNQYTILKTWTLSTFDEWEALREEIFPLSDLLGAYEIYLSDRKYYAADIAKAEELLWVRGEERHIKREEPTQ